MMDISTYERGDNCPMIYDLQSYPKYRKTIIVITPKQTSLRRDVMKILLGLAIWAVMLMAFNQMFRINDHFFVPDGTSVQISTK